MFKTANMDEVINFYVAMMMQEEGSIYSFSTFFMIRLYERGNYTFKNVARWSKKLDIFRHKKMFIPINYEHEHWVLVVIDLTIMTIFFYDGFKRNGGYFVRCAILVWNTAGIAFNDNLVANVALT